MADTQLRTCPTCGAQMYLDFTGWYCSNSACGHAIPMPMHLWCVRVEAPDGSVGNIHIAVRGDSMDPQEREAVEAAADRQIAEHPGARRTHRAEWLAPESAEYRQIRDHRQYRPLSDG